MQCYSFAAKILVISFFGLFVQATSAENTSATKQDNSAKAQGSKVSYQSLNGALQPAPKNSQLIGIHFQRRAA